MRFPAITVICLAGSIAFGSASLAVEIVSDTVWSGEVTVEQDNRVVPGVTLTIEPGTVVTFLHTDSTKTDPQFWNPDTELAVEGRLLALGTAEKPIRFQGDTGWGGIILAEGGEGEISNATLTGAEEGILFKSSSLTATSLLVEKCETGIVLGPGATLKAQGIRVISCEKGVLDLSGGRNLPEGVTVLKASDAPYLSKPWEDQIEKSPSNEKKPGGPVREFVGEYTVNGEETWTGTIYLNGRVTVPPESTLKISAGTSVLFRKRDTNGDGLGEGELLILGSVRSMGTADAPVVFDSAEEVPAPGDWDKVSIISSEDGENRFDHTVFRHGIQALHAHFSSFGAYDCLFEKNLRALQFQESERAVVKRSIFRGNKQALRFRDSTALVEDCLLTGNDFALHTFRSTVEFKNNKITDTLLGGVLAKESNLKFTGNELLRSRSPFKARGEDSVLLMEKSRILDAVESSISLADTRANLNGNRISGAGLDLLGLEGGEVVLRNNTLGTSLRDAIHLNSSTGADASCNDWSGEIPAARIHDFSDDPGLGKVLLDVPCE